jgi:NAD(P)-dependent dehydrogenase (short-subunit alcohol dehydrogenase family)
MDLAQKTFLVVGGSGVLGAAFTQALHAAGALALSTATSNDSAGRIPAVASVRLLLDYQQPESIETLADYLLASDSSIDGVINAAGLVAFGPASETPPEVTERLMRVNALGPMQLLAALHPALKRSAEAGSSPTVVNLSGVVAEQPLPNMAAYSASKLAIHGYLQALAREWRRDGIRVLDARPGHTETGLAGRAIAGTAPQFPTGMTPAQVVERVMRAIVEDERDLPSTAF